MSLFDNLSKKIGDVAQNAAKVSGELVEITKINVNIKAEEDNINKIYNEIGRYYFGQFEAGVQLDEFIMDHCHKIKGYELHINDLKEKIKEIKNIEICEVCGSETARTNTFCGKCGSKINIKENQAEYDDSKEGSDI